MRQYSARRSDTRWLHKLLDSSRSTFKSPRIMGSLKCCRASSRSDRLSNVEGGRHIWELPGNYSGFTKVMVSGRNVL